MRSYLVEVAFEVAFDVARAAGLDAGGAVIVAIKALRSYNQCIAPARRARAGRKSRIRNFTHALDRRSAVELPLALH